MKSYIYSGIIAGSGIAGLFAALKLSDVIGENGKILIVTKTDIKESNSRYAQGGIVGVLLNNKKDSTDLHLKDTKKAGDGLCNTKTVNFISENSEKAINDLINYGVEFDRDENNSLKLTLEGAHSVKRILHCGGDATGLGIEKVLAQRVSAQKNIVVKEQTVLADILTNEKNECKGIIAFDTKSGEYTEYISDIIILATGGAGQLYKHTTNPTVTTGDGMAAAYRAGAIMQDMEFVQFHPTALKDKFGENMFLISEAVRGEGAKLADKNGNTFMEKYDERLELASRDIVTRAIFSELSKSGDETVFLDATMINKDKFETRFPTINGVCIKNGVDPSKDFIPVSPAAHYIMGGIKTDIKGRTSLKNLYAIGECACTGLHGANRLASNSLLECVVMANSVSEYIKEQKFYENKNKICENDKNIRNILNIYNSKIPDFSGDITVLKNRLKNIMWSKAGVIRNERDLSEALMKIEEIEKEFAFPDKCPSKDGYELRNLITVGKLVIKSALNRKESRGGHFRSDFPQKNEPPLHSELSKQKEVIYVK